MSWNHSQNQIPPHCYRVEKKVCVSHRNRERKRERERERESHSKIQVANVETDLSSLKIAILLVQSDSLVLLAPTISVINVGQFRGHSCFTIYNMDVCTYMCVSTRVQVCIAYMQAYKQHYHSQTINMAHASTYQN